MTMEKSIALSVQGNSLRQIPVIFILNVWAANVVDTFLGKKVLIPSRNNCNFFYQFWFQMLIFCLALS